MTKSSFQHANYSRICTRFEPPRGTDRPTTNAIFHHFPPSIYLIRNPMDDDDGDALEEENSSAATFIIVVFPFCSSEHPEHTTTHYFYITNHPDQDQARGTIGWKMKRKSANPDREGRLPPPERSFSSSPILHKIYSARMKENSSLLLAADDDGPQSRGK